ncbi:STM4015 family protein [Nocardia jiangxiensis]|uniref:STM4015 family protein n=1 Tax=Nocardia jiangxiensis TaxID=282685 RepID=A0ABW6S2F9_9NOCA|nr:STM4015 family protein [Nocardia jiangxiensis]
MTTIHDHLEEFYGLPVHDFPEVPDASEALPELPAADSVAWRVRVDYDEDEETWVDRFTRLLDTVAAERVRALIVGSWGAQWENSSAVAVEALVAARDRLPELRAIFLGDITMEEAEISWIIQSEVSPILVAFPELEEFGVRGGQQLAFASVRHERLAQLTVQSGGLSGEAVRGIAGCDLPALTHLDLWLGTEDYGGDCEVSDLAPILTGAKLPGLRDLALRNSEIQDRICVALATAPVVAQLEGLDVSMGVLTDEGAGALLTGQSLTHLTSLDMHYNFLSESMRSAVRSLLEPAGVEVDVDVDDAGYDEDYRYVAVGE